MSWRRRRKGKETNGGDIFLPKGTIDEIANDQKYLLHNGSTAVLLVLKSDINRRNYIFCVPKTNELQVCSLSTNALSGRRLAFQSLPRRIYLYTRYSAPIMRRLGGRRAVRLHGDANTVTLSLVLFENEPVDCESLSQSSPPSSSSLLSILSHVKTETSAAFSKAVVGGQLWLLLAVPDAIINFSYSPSQFGDDITTADPPLPSIREGHSTLSNSVTIANSLLNCTRFR